MLRKWMSNEKEVVAAIPHTDRGSASGDFSSVGSVNQSTLGCTWEPEDYTLGVKATDAEVPSTKRGLLKRISMIFDGLGFSLYTAS